MFVLFLALLLDLWIGDPDFLWRRMSHPVVGFGKIISLFDRSRGPVGKMFNPSGGSKGQERTAGLVLVIALFVASFVASWLIAAFLQIFGPLGTLLEALVVSVFLAQKSLREHVERVIHALKHEGVEGARKAVSMIVGRDVSQLEEPGISKAAIESLAENFSDGVVAPAFWYAIFGLPGILFYKAVNTADSMIGHRNDRYEDFGKAAAVLDDWLNWPAARLSALLVLVSAVTMRGVSFLFNAFEIVRRDAPLHNSPNAGWPEAAFAVVLDICLGGRRVYGSQTLQAAVLNRDGRAELTIEDVRRALTLYQRTGFVLLGLVGFLWLLF